MPKVKYCVTEQTNTAGQGAGNNPPSGELEG